MPAISAAIALLSRPPDRNMPSGTSAISRDAHRLLEQLAEPLRRRRCSESRVDARSRRPTGTSQYCAGRDRAVLEHQRVAGQQPVDALEQRLGARQVARARAARAAAARPPRRGSRPLSRIDLISDPNSSRLPATRPVERLDAEAVAREQQPPARRVPDREREHAAEALDAARRPTARRRGRSSRCRSACGSGGRAASSSGPDVGVVVDLAVEDDPDRAVLVARAADARRRGRRCSGGGGRAPPARRQ